MSEDVTINKSVWDALRARAARLDRAYVKVGILAGKGAEQKEGELSLVEIAACHEFGTDTIPERSFIRATFNVIRKEDLKVKQAELARAVVTGGMDPKRALGILGSWGSNAVKKTIVDKQTMGPEPQELKQATIDAREREFGKASTTPLIATGGLKNSISYEVSDDEAAELEGV